MKKLLISFLLVLCLPVGSWGYDDSCSKPDEYTVDKRCYVTDEQKQQKPYNSMVKMETYSEPIKIRINDKITATGTLSVDSKVNRYGVIVKQDDGLYLIRTDCPSKKFKIQTYDGIEIILDNDNIPYYGDGFYVSACKYKIPDEYAGIASTNLSNKANVGGYEASIVAESYLKIMSDAEIEDFKAKYINYLKERKGINSKGNKGRGWVKGGVDMESSLGQMFFEYLRDNETSYFENIFYDGKKLKMSHCQYSPKTGVKGCYGYPNYNGGIFDDNGDLVGIFLGQGYYAIGGEHHAGKDVSQKYDIYFAPQE